MTGTFIISIDFELHWGVYDTKSLKSYGANLKGVQQAIPGMLDLFDKYDIKTTFATVGMLFYRDKKSILGHLPSRFPTYENERLNPYYKIERILGENEDTDCYHYGRSMIEKIMERNKHEIGSHTFCHYYCLETGQTIFEFEADLEAFRLAASTVGSNPVSLVFPKNQLRYNYLRSLVKYGYTNYRGNEDSWVYKPHAKHGENLVRRGLRFLDAYVNITGQHIHDEMEMAAEFPFNIQSSRFLRPYSTFSAPLEPLKIRRVKKAMQLAAERNKVYHLWWHPHNFGLHTKKNLQSLEKILIHYIELRDKYGFANKTMGEFAEYLNMSYYEPTTLGKGTGQKASSQKA